jgi:hypothetical protein
MQVLSIYKKFTIGKLISSLLFSHGPHCKLEKVGSGYEGDIAIRV